MKKRVSYFRIIFFILFLLGMSVPSWAQNVDPIAHIYDFSPLNNHKYYNISSEKSVKKIKYLGTALYAGDKIELPKGVDNAWVDVRFTHGEVVRIHPSMSSWLVKNENADTSHGVVSKISKLYKILFKDERKAKYTSATSRSAAKPRPLSIPFVLDGQTFMMYRNDISLPLVWIGDNAPFTVQVIDHQGNTYSHDEVSDVSHNLGESEHLAFLKLPLSAQQENVKIVIKSASGEMFGFIVKYMNETDQRHDFVSLIEQQKKLTPEWKLEAWKQVYQMPVSERRRMLLWALFNEKEK